MSLRTLCLASLGLLPLLPAAKAEPIPVRNIQGTEHAFLSLRSLDGKLIAVGDLNQVAHPTRVVAHTIFRFKDGSLDDETTIFSQRGTFRLISDHHIQKGPSFPKPMDLLVEGSGNITSKSIDKDGKEKVTHDHMDLPPDVANGLELTLLMNLPANTPEVKVSRVVLAIAGKPRVIQFAIHSEGADPFSTAGESRKATHFVVKLELGGLLGVAAPLVGKQPSDIHAWITPDPAPAFIREEGQLFEGGPVWRIEQISPAFANDTRN
jgi:hypothetical protein